MEKRRPGFGENRFQGGGLTYREVKENRTERGPRAASRALPWDLSVLHPHPSPEGPMGPDRPLGFLESWDLGLPPRDRDRLCLPEGSGQGVARVEGWAVELDPGAAPRGYVRRPSRRWASGRKVGRAGQGPSPAVLDSHIQEQTAQGPKRPKSPPSGALHRCICQRKRLKHFDLTVCSLTYNF